MKNPHIKVQTQEKDVADRVNTEPSLPNLPQTKDGVKSALAVPVHEVDSQGSSFRVNAPAVEVMSLKTGANEPLETMQSKELELRPTEVNPSGPASRYI